MDHLRGIAGLHKSAQKVQAIYRMVRPERFELPTSWFVARRSIQLSYGRICKPNPGNPEQTELPMAFRAWPTPGVLDPLAEREGFEPSMGF